MKESASWPALKALMAHKTVTSMYIWLAVVPLVANALRDLKTNAQLNVFGHTFDIVLKLPFSWECFFFAALFFTLGSALYTIFCPTLIKQFDDFGQFDRSGRSLDELLPYGANVAAKAVDYIDRLGPEEKVKRESFWRLHNRAIHARPRLRALCAGCFALGGLLLLVVFSMNCWWVIERVFGW